MNKKLSYKGYTTIIQYSNEDKVYFGKLENMNDIITFETQNIEDMELTFKNTVDIYIQDRNILNNQNSTE
jgi:predicted HicB family RNase H-like nuclease